MITFILNRKKISTDLPSGMVVLDFLRQSQRLVGTKEPGSPETNEGSPETNDSRFLVPGSPETNENMTLSSYKITNSGEPRETKCPELCITNPPFFHSH